ncbi:MAG: hypothetical protein ABIW17_03465 [Marmoricola sp.]
MNRTTAVALIAAGIVGIAGGTVSAVVRGEDTGTTPSPVSSRTPKATPKVTSKVTPSASPSATSTSSPSAVAEPGPAETNEPLLYAKGGKIHDGTRVVAFPKGRVQRLARAGDGWLVATSASVEDFVTFNLWWLTDSTPARRLAEVSSWDPDADGRRVAAYDVNAGQVKVWSLPTTKVTGVYATEGSPVLTPGFAGHDVLISQDIGTQIDLVRWNPDTGHSKIIGIGYDALSLSPGGSYLTGAVGPEGASGDTNPCLHLESTYLKKHHVSWKTCDWRVDSSPTRFSPDGTRLIAIPADSDGFGPGEFGIIDASDGPRKLVATVKAPALTLGAEWADNDHLYLYGSNNEDTASGGMWIKRCDLEGQCTPVATAKGNLTVGSGL